jgi:hypothetical protein
MARDSITQLWGGKAPEFPARFLRVVLAVLVAVPLAFLSLSVADKAQLPELVTLVISPGQLGIYAVPQHVGFWDSLWWFVEIGMTINVAYYACLLMWLLRILERKVPVTKRASRAC